MRGIKRYFPVSASGNYNLRSTRQRTSSSYPPVMSLSNGNGRGRRTVVARGYRRNKRSYKPRRAFSSIRRHRGRRGTRKSRRVTIAKVIRSLTPLHSLSYAHAGRVVVGNSTAFGPACTYYFPNSRGISTNVTASAARIGTNETIVNGSGASQVFPSADDMNIIASKITSIDGNSSRQAISFFTPSVQFWVGNYRVTTKLVNQSNAQAIVEVFTCVIRKDINTGASNLRNLLSNGLAEKLAANDQANYNPVLHDDYVRDDQLSPFDSGKFCGYVKMSSRKMVINSGDIKIVTHGSKGMRKINPSTFSTLTSTTSTWGDVQGDIYCRKGAVFQFFRITGQPTNDATNKSLLGKTSPAIVFTHDYHFQYRFMVEAGSTNSRLGHTGFGAVASASVMEEQSNTVSAQENA